MNFIDYVEIENFKGLDRIIRIPFGNPSVIIGPNNAGKTTVLQALSLWGRAVKAWIAKKGSGHQKAKRDAVGINRLLIMDIPVKETRYFWHATRINANRKNIPFSICVGVRMGEGEVRPLKMVFTYRDPETLYSKPSDDCMGDSELLESAARLNFNLLYPMSGLAGGDDGHVEETRLMDGRINVLLGQGQTAQVLRNLCYKVWETDRGGWEQISAIMDRMFAFKLGEPKYDEMRGSISLDYTQLGVDEPLELSLAGRGVQQLLLILAYLFTHKNGVLMIDEPDAHLEILRQKQVFVILKDAAEITNCQIVIATHSEVILDEAVDLNLTSIVNGTVTDLSAAKEVKLTLRSLGVQHYYKALVARRLLMTEGSTDVEMLRAFARKLEHPAASILNERLFTFYMQTQDPNAPGSTVERLDRVSMSGIDFRQYYFTLKRLVPDLKAIALRDGDGKKHTDKSGDDDFTIRYWTQYELENYFISPERLEEFVISEIGKRDGELFAVSDACRADIKMAMDATLSEMVFDGDAGSVDEYYHLSPTMKPRFLQKVKMSAFAETFFEKFSEVRGNSVLVNKGGYCRLISLLKKEDVPQEIVETLDLICRVFNG